MEKYDEKYFQERDWYASKNSRLNKIIKVILQYKPKRVLDVGCGQGYLVKKLREINIEATGVDVSEFAGELIPDWFVQTDARKLPFLNNSFDVVVSTDFFEHIPEENIDQVYSEMKRVGKDIVAMICFKKEREYHLTIKPRIWWEVKLPKCQLL